MRAVVIALAVAGCSLSPDYSGTSFQCDDGQTCPPGYDCVAGRCVDPATVDPDASAPDAAPQPDAGDPDAGDPVSARCGTVGMLRDDFEDGSEDAKWAWSWADTGSTKQETGGELVLTTVGGAAGEPWAGYMSVFLYDHTDIATEVEVTGSEPPWTLIEVTSPAGVKLQLMRYEADLEVAVYTPATGYLTRAEIPFDTAAHRHWRIREEAGTTYWETSADGDSWSAVHSEANPTQMSAVHVLLGAGGARAGDSQARFAAVNLGGDPNEGWCPASSMSDDFDDGERAPDWSWWFDDAGCTVSETGGQLVLAFDGSADSWCGYKTGRPFDLADSTVAVEVPATLDGGSTYLKLQSGANELGIRRDGGLVTWYDGGGGTSQSTINFDATAHRWWRLRETAGTVYWETSADGASWSERASMPTPFDVSAVQLELAAGVGGTALGAPAEVQYDNLNQP